MGYNLFITEKRRRFLLKYWRGYLVAAILAAITWAFTKLAERFSILVDMVYPYLTRTVQSFLADWTGGVNFCLWQILVVLAIVALLTTLVLMIVFRWNFFQWLGWVLTGAVLVAFLHTGLYGLNFYAGPLANDLRMNISGYTLEELEEATIYYRDKANELAISLELLKDLPGDSERDLIPFGELAWGDDL